VQAVSFQLSAPVGAGQPGGSVAPPSHDATDDGAVQNRSVESEGAVKQYPRASEAPSEPAAGAQSSSDRQGEQKLPSPTQTPARGMHTLVPLTHFAPAGQSVALEH